MADNGSPNPEIPKPEIKVLFTIGVNKEDMVMVSGDLNNKKLCYHLLAEAIKIVADYQPAIIRTNLFNKSTHRLINFARSLKR